MKKNVKQQKMPPYRPFEKPANGGMREVVEYKPIKLKHKKD